MESPDEFISEAVTPEAGTFDTRAMSRGEPGLPRRFAWRGQVYEAVELLRTWKTSTRERGELYLRRHWFEVLVSSGEQSAPGVRMTLYCERQTKQSNRPKQRWWLYSIHRTGP